MVIMPYVAMRRLSFRALRCPGLNRIPKGLLEHSQLCVCPKRSTSAELFRSSGECAMINFFLQFQTPAHAVVSRFYIQDEKFRARDTLFFLSCYKRRNQDHHNYLQDG